MANALARETSPYLLQHADNPVDWHPWNDETLALARASGRPILLSIGYSACHWCHVMAHESFEDPETARVMNELYVNVKVDREERPDLDRIYQTSQQLLSGRPGGWPLTMFLTPEGHLPIFAGTYFPKEPRYGMPAFKEVLVRVAAYFRSHAEEIRRNGDALVEALGKLNGEADRAAALDAAPLREARRRLGESFDSHFGGFGGAPKFPHTSDLDFLLREWLRSRARGEEDGGARRMLTFSLTRMALAGLYDHLGGGFFRYSIDREWRIPHFEKMLYDNAAMLAIYSDAYAATGEPLFGRVAGETADWVLRDMRDPRGGFYATLDADSAGEEGKFYLWTPAEIDALLDPDSAALVTRRFGLDEPANFEGSAWHLQISADANRSALAADPATFERLERARSRLREAREQRPWPGRDEKILAGWNGFMIAALARASRHLHRPELAVAAERALDFLCTELWDGRLRASYKDGRARFAGYLDDYAFLAAGLVELLQCRWRSSDLELAVALVDVVLEHFADPAGGFFFTADDHERLIHRPKPLADEAMPSGNAVAALTLSDLGHLLGEPRYLEAAAGTLRAALPAISQYPQAHATLLEVLARELEPPELIVIRGTQAQLERWRIAAQAEPRAARLTFAIPDDATALPGLLGARQSVGRTVAYVCSGTECRAPGHGEAQVLTQ